jgi:intein/homing endonuclease
MVTQAINIKEGDIFIDDSGTEHIINSIEDMSGTFNTYKIDVEENDTYIANNIITHNRKLQDPV